MNTNPPSVAIIVLNWNGINDTLACLDSIAALTYPNFKVIVVDNCSTDDSLVRLRPLSTIYPLTLLETGRNLGYAGGNNVGIKRALELDADYVLLLNNDTEIDPGILTAFVTSAQAHPEAGALGARIYYHSDPKRIWCIGAKWSPVDGRFVQLGEGRIDSDEEYGKECITDYACGCAIFIPANRFREIGFLDEDFFLYFEETDWCYRARKAGHPSFYVPNAKLWHKVSVSFGGENSPLATYFIIRNRLLWGKRHLSFLQRTNLYWTTFFGLIRKFLSIFGGAQLNLLFKPKKLWWLARQTFLAPMNRAYFLGARDFCLGQFGNCPEIIRALNKEWVSK